MGASNICFLINAGILPPFAMQTEDTRASGRHCTVGIEPRVTSEQIILLNTHVCFHVHPHRLCFSFVDEDGGNMYSSYVRKSGRISENSKK